MGEICGTYGSEQNDMGEICGTYGSEQNDMGVTCGTYGSEQKCIQLFVGKMEGKRPLRNPWHNGRKILKCVIQ
jgi:hypothetical protein